MGRALFASSMLLRSVWWQQQNFTVGASLTFLELIISQRHIVPLPSEVLVASGLYCKILTQYKIIKLIQCTTNAWLLLFLSFLRLFLFVYKNTNSSDVWSHRECLVLGVIPPRTSLRQGPKWDGVITYYFSWYHHHPDSDRAFNKMTVTMTPFFKTFCPQNGSVISHH